VSESDYDVLPMSPTVLGFSLCRSKATAPFTFALDIDRDRTIVSDRTIRLLAIDPDHLPGTLKIQDRIEFPLLRLDRITVGPATLSDFEVIVWGAPRLAKDIGDELDRAGDILLTIGQLPKSAIESVVECRGVLGLDFLTHFIAVTDFMSGSLSLQTRRYLLHA
jgi:hypothetical protein